MERVLQGLKPDKCFYYFEEISRIPRNSYQEKEISDYLVRFARERGLKFIQDEAANVLISKPATPGFEKRKKIMLQGHMDMVCVKDEGVEHDFDKDPIPLYIDGDYLRAKGTTLGADNGNALALGLAILDSDDIPHPDLQVIFTTAEEVGLIGAMQLHPEHLEGDYLINLDGGKSNKLLLSSAGGSVHTFMMDGNGKSVEDTGWCGLRLSVQGLTSGHSGSLIHRGYGNAIKLMGNILSALADRLPYELSSFTGGTKMNAIAKESVSEILVPFKQVQEAKCILASLKDCILKEYQETDSEMTIIIEEIAPPKEILGGLEKERFLGFIDLLHDGTYKFMNQERAMAKTSCNMGVLEQEGCRLKLTCLMRSNSDYEHDELIRKTKRLSALYGIEHEIKDRSAAWEYRPDSDLVRQVSALYQASRGEALQYAMTHGGVEPGIIIDLGRQAGKEIQAINFGVDGGGAHTTGEYLYITSMEETYEWLKLILRSLD